MSIATFQNKFQDHQKLCMLTCYDFTFAKILEQSDIDGILVGDSLAMVIHGHDDTTHATNEMMQLHTSAVRKGAKSKFIVADLPFLSYRQGQNMALQAAGKLIQAGANAVKLEGADGNLDCVQYMVESGIPVMGHLGLTPQFIHQFGGWKVQAKTKEAQTKLLEDAKALERAGCFSIVLECVPSTIASQVQKELSIPCIGIGAGSEIAGQILVLQDMLGMQDDFKPKFVRDFANMKSLSLESIKAYIQSVQTKSFPNSQESYQ